MASKIAKKTIKRTDDIMKAMAALDRFKQRITAVQDALEKKEFTLNQTCHEVCAIGVKIQKVSTLIRPHTVEGDAKIIYKNQKSKFLRHVEKNIDDKAWLVENCAKPKTNGRYLKNDYGSKERQIVANVSSHKAPKEFYSFPDSWKGKFVIPSKKWLKENS